MIMINNPSGDENNPVDLNEESSASRIGDRIRKIRTVRGLSQGELGAKVNLSADRIQKYENGARKPKIAMLKQLAEALDVNPLALADPVTTNYIGAMYAMFELENTFNMKIEEKTGDIGFQMCLSVDSRDSLYEYMEEWYKFYMHTQSLLRSATSAEEKERLMNYYYDWEWNFPQGIVDKTTREMQKIQIKNKIEELQKMYDKLEGEDK